MCAHIHECTSTEHVRVKTVEGRESAPSGADVNATVTEDADLWLAEGKPDSQPSWGSPYLVVELLTATFQHNKSNEESIKSQTFEK